MDGRAAASPGAALAEPPRHVRPPRAAAAARARLAPTAAALVNHYRRPAAALLLYALLAVALMAPLASTVLPDTPAQDLANHVSGIIEAGNALAEGQFPIRVSPHQCHDERYPTFQFYGNLPYTAGGLLYHFLSVRPFAACKLLLLLALTGGAF